jgi:hypothetical protein
MANQHEHLNNILTRLYGQPDWSTWNGSDERGPFSLSADNATVLGKIERELRTHFTDQEFWIVNVPSSSEQLGHHVPWRRHDGQWVEPEFAERLRGAYRLLHAGVVRYVFISGGKIVRLPDPNNGQRMPDFRSSDGTSYPANIDAMCGREYMLQNFSAHWDATPNGTDTASTLAHMARQDLRPETYGQHDPLSSRILVDPYAIHTESNVRNCDRLCAWLGLERNLICTTFAKPSLKYAQGDGFCNVMAEWVTQLKFLGFGYSEGSFHRLRSTIALDGTRTAPDGTGVFGDASHDFPNDALLRPRSFTAFGILLVAPTRLTESETEIGVILHHKLDLESLRVDTSYQEQD